MQCLICNNHVIIIHFMNFLSPVSSRNEGSSSIHCMPHVCGPCYLCKNMANYYKHRNDLVPRSHRKAHCCYCRRLHMLELHQRHKTQYQQSQLETKMDSAYQCVVPACTNKKESAIICRLSSSTRILDLLGLPTAEHQHSDGVPLCPAHYRFIHRTLHESDHTYKEIKCTVCSMAIKTNNIRHCPNPVIIEEHYRTHTDFTCSITTDDPIKNNRCKCKKSGNCCMPGCKCINCKNLPNDSSPPPLNDNPTPLPNDNPPPLTNNTLSDDNSSDSDTDFESFLYHNL